MSTFSFVDAIESITSPAKIFPVGEVNKVVLQLEAEVYITSRTHVGCVVYNRVQE